MAYVTVFLVALLSGALVYWLTLRAGQDEAFDLSIDAGGGFLPEAPETPGGYSYATSVSESGGGMPIGTEHRSWQTRTMGVLWLLIAITLAAALLAFSLYQGGSVVARLISDYAS
jgi:hypothetical protein